MSQYEYAGPGPHDDGQGGLVRPGDVRSFDTDPGWGPWVLLPDEPAGGAVSDSAVPATPTPVPGADVQPPAGDDAGTASSAPPPDNGTKPGKGA